MPTLVCPRCGVIMTVSEFAPTLLTCRSCLAKVPNPTGLPPGTLVPQSAMTPRRVIPIEQQVAGDTRAASITLFVLGGVLCGATALSYGVPSFRRISIGLGLVALLTLTVAVLQLIYPDSEEVRVAAGVFRGVGKSILAIILILCGVVALLIGACFVLMTGSYWHG